MEDEEMKFCAPVPVDLSDNGGMGTQGLKKQVVF